MQTNLGKVDDYLEELLGIEPVYHGEYGDSCRLHLRSGASILDRRSIRSVKLALTRSKALNQVYLRRLCGDELGRQLSLPIPLSAGLILVPLKMRQPVTGNDSAYGLVNSLGVRKVAECPTGGSLILLDSGQTLKVLSGRDTTLSHLAEGTLIHKHFLKTVWGF